MLVVLRLRKSALNNLVSEPLQFHRMAIGFYSLQVTLLTFFLTLVAVSEQIAIFFVGCWKWKEEVKDGVSCQKNCSIF